MRYSSDEKMYEINGFVASLGKDYCGNKMCSYDKLWDKSWERNYTKVEMCFGDSDSLTNNH